MDLARIRAVKQIYTEAIGSLFISGNPPPAVAGQRSARRLLIDIPSTPLNADLLRCRRKFKSKSHTNMGCQNSPKIMSAWLAKFRPNG
jgi:hypothetical protein